MENHYAPLEPAGKVIGCDCLEEEVVAAGMASDFSRRMLAGKVSCSGHQVEQASVGKVTWTFHLLSAVGVAAQYYPLQPSVGLYPPPPSCRRAFCRETYFFHPEDA